MTTDPPVLGLVAGDGVYPEYIVRGARRRTPELRIVACLLIPASLAISPRERSSNRNCPYISF